MLLVVILFGDEINAFINNLIPFLSQPIATLGNTLVPNIVTARTCFHPVCVYHSVKSPSCNCHVFNTRCTENSMRYLYTHARIYTLRMDVSSEWFIAQRK